MSECEKARVRQAKIREHDKESYQEDLEKDCKYKAIKKSSQLNRARRAQVEGKNTAKGLSS